MDENNKFNLLTKRHQTQQLNKIMIETNEKNIPNENNMYLLKALYLMKKSTPISQTFLFILFFTKY